MKKVLVLFLIAAFLTTVSGCTPKSEYDKLLDEKAGIAKKCKELSSDRTQLNQTISARQMEIKDLRNDLRNANAKIKNLQRGLAKVKADLAASSK